MYVTFAFMIFFCICIRIHDLHLHSHLYPWFTFMICTHDLHLHDLHSHSHVCCIGIHIHNLHLWCAFACMSINYVLIYICMFASIFVYVLCNNTSNKDFMCMHQTTLNNFLRNISHMQTCICNGYDAEKKAGKCSLHVPTNHPSMTTKLCTNGLEIKACTFPPPTPLSNDNVHVCNEMWDLCMYQGLSAILNAAIVAWDTLILLTYMYFFQIHCK